MFGGSVPGALVLDLADIRLVVAVRVIIEMPPGRDIVKHAARCRLNHKERRENSCHTVMNRLFNRLHKEPFLKSKVTITQKGPLRHVAKSSDRGRREKGGRNKEEGKRQEEELTASQVDRGTLRCVAVMKQARISPAVRVFF